MSSPAQRYAQSRRRTQYPALNDFRAGYPFDFDDFQTRACEALEDGYGVLVCAPTGAGKTLVGEFAIHLALAVGQKCFYTTPIKALSNQKYNDLIERYGSDQVGLLTGDNSINSHAPIVVMTTEVLRNMLYVGSDALAGLGYVVMDEVHYLGDRFRGPVWEEVIIHLPESVRLVSLSATVSNAEEFGDWLVEVRGDTRVIVHEQRPVPLWQHMLVGNQMFDLFDAGQDAGEVDKSLARYVDERMRYVDGHERHADGRERRGAGPRRGSGHGPRWRPPSRPAVITRLDREALLPAITFVFSRAGCDAAVRQCVAAGIRLATDEERAEIRGVAEARTAGLAPSDLDVLGYWDFLDGLERGLAAHHAGLIPVFKETVEELFTRGLVRMVFATETLALGINMPARTVVLERLVKFNGETHADLTPGEYTQLTGRAGRRGIDVEGHAVVLWSPSLDPKQVAGLASKRTYPLRSSFRPSYNMSVNLVSQVGRHAARELLESSFAQFQADRSVVGIQRQIARTDKAMDELRAKMRCHLGDFADYNALRVQISEREKSLSKKGAAQRRATVAQSLEALSVGDVVRIPTGRHAGLAAVLDPGTSPIADPRPLVVTEGRWAGRLSMIDFPTSAEVLGRVKVGKNFNHRSPAARRDLASAIRTLRIPDEPRGRRRSGRGLAADDVELAELRAALRAHPCHGCADREAHARYAERFNRLERENESLRRKAEGRTHSLARTFDRVCALLAERGYLAADVEAGEHAVTEAGRQLSRIWSESDLLIAECLRSGAWAGLKPAELAAVCSAVVYEARREDARTPRPPTSALGGAVAATTRLWGELTEREAFHRLPLTREPDVGFMWASYRWTRGDALDKVLVTEDGTVLPAGDFVRWMRQVLDLLEQLSRADVIEPGLRNTAAGACAAIRRGVVAQQL